VSSTAGHVRINATKNKVIAYHGVSTGSDTDQAVAIDNYVVQFERLADITAGHNGRVGNGGSAVEHAVSYHDYVRPEENAGIDAAVFAEIDGRNERRRRV